MANQVSTITQSSEGIMRTTKTLIAAIGGSLSGLALLALAPPAALGQQAEDCNGFISIDYGPALVQKPGDTVTVKLTFGAGEIVGGPITPPLIFFPTFHFFLDCTPGSPSMITPSTCIDDGPVVSYNGDATIITTCHVGGNSANPLVTWASNNPAGGPSPNTLTFTPTPAVTSVAGATAPAGQCSLVFKVTVLSLPTVSQCVGFPVGDVCNTSADCPLGHACEPEIPEIADFLPLAVCTNALTAGGFQTGAIEVAGGVFPPGSNNFDCYEVTGGAVPQGTVELQDRFLHKTGVKLSFEHRVCPTVNKNGETPDAVTSPQHLTGYGLPKTGFDANTDVTVMNEFGTVAGHVGKGVRLLVPAAKAIGKHVDPGPIPSGLADADCYKFTASVANFTATLQDQFSVIKNPGSDMQKFQAGLLLCVPANKNNEDPAAVSDPSGLLCYHRLRPNNVTIPQGLGASTRDQLQLDENLNVTEFQELCVASTVTVP
jgi:hypothetical protein